MSINGTLDYDRITQAITLLADTVANTETDEFIWSIGESGHFHLDSLIVGAYWHYSEWHGGQSSPEYAALSSLGGVFSPNMSILEVDSSEYDVYSQLNDLAEAKHNV